MTGGFLSWPFAIQLLTASPHASTIIDHPTTASVAQSVSISGAIIAITSGGITGEQRCC